MSYALVKDGEIIGFSDDAPNTDQSQLAAGKPRWLPIDVETVAFDPVSQVRLPVSRTVETTRVLEVRAVRAKDSGEIADMKAAKDAEIDAEFQRLCNAPISFTIDATDYSFHADSEARENITGILQMYDVQDALGENVAEPMPDPRPFTPMESAPIMITRAQLGQLGHAIGVRKDKLFVIKKTKQYMLSILTDPVDIDAFDPLAGWGLS